MATNDFLPFATAGGANVLSQADWVALAARLSGYVAGVASSNQINKGLRQSASMTTAVGRFIAEIGNLDALDDGNIDNLLDALVGSIRSQRPNFVTTVGGTANAVTLTLDPAIPSLANLSAVPLRFRTNLAPSGLVSINVDGLGAIPLVAGLTSVRVSANAYSAGAWLEIVYDQNAGVFRVTSGLSIIAAAPTIYVRTDGNDNNDGSANTAGSAMLTIAGALNRARGLYFAGSDLLIQLGNAGTYASPIDVPVMSGRVRIRGDIASQATYIIDGIGSAGAAVLATSGRLALEGLRVNNNGSIASTLSAFGGGQITISNVDFTSQVANSFAHISASAGGSIIIGAGCRAFGNMGYLMFASGGGTINQGAVAFSIPNAVTYGTTVYCQSAGSITFAGGASFSAGTVFGNRYNANLNGVINTFGGGANFIPGNVAGTTPTGGQYA